VVEASTRPRRFPFTASLVLVLLVALVLPSGFAIVRNGPPASSTHLSPTVRSGALWPPLPRPAVSGACPSLAPPLRPAASLLNLTAEGTGAWASANRSVLANNSGINATLPVPSAHPSTNQYILLAIEDPTNASAAVAVGVAETTLPILGTLAEAVAYLPNGTEIYSTSGPFLTRGQSDTLAIHHAHGDWWSLTSNGQAITGGASWENGTYDLGAATALGVGCGSGAPLAPSFVAALYGNGTAPPALPTTLVKRAIGIAPSSGTPASYLPVAANAIPQLDPGLGTVDLAGSDQNASLPSGSLLIGTSSTLGYPGTGASLWGHYEFRSLGNATLAPENVTVTEGSPQVFRASALDIDGTALAGAGFAWQVRPASLGTLNASLGPSVTFTAGATAGPGVLWVNVSFNCSTVSVRTNLTVAAGPGPPILSFTASPAAVEIGERSTLVVQTGTWPRPVSYTYAGLPPGCGSANASQLACLPTAAGAFQPTVYVNDSLGLSSRASAALTVDPPLTLTAFTASPDPATSGASVTISVQATGGVPPLSYSFGGMPPGCPEGAAPATVTCQPTVPSGTYRVQVLVNDSSGNSLPAHLILTVVPATGALLVTSFRASPSAVDVGTTATLSVNATGGDAPLSYAYAGLPAGCRSENTSRLACTPNATGTYTIAVHVTDRSGALASANLSLEVSAPPSASARPSSSALPLAIALIVVAIAAGAATVAFGLRRRSRPPPLG
jgi:hypothetical protein